MLRSMSLRSGLPWQSLPSAEAGTVGATRRRDWQQEPLAQKVRLLSAWNTSSPPQRDYLACNAILRAVGESWKGQKARTVANESDESIPKQLALREFFYWAWAKHLKRERRGPGETYRSPMFDFIRDMQAHPDMKGLSASEALQRLKSIKIERTGKSLSWVKMFPDSEDPETEFLSTWDQILIPAGEDFLEYACSLAQQKPVSLRNPISEKYARFCSIALHLPVLRRAKHITLPRVRLGEILGVSGRTVCDLVRVGIQNGFVVPQEKAHPLTHAAAKYRFACERFDPETLKEKELKPEEESHFNKDFEDSEGFEDSKDSGGISRTAEEHEGISGSQGVKEDFERLSRILGGEISHKKGAPIPIQRREKARMDIQELKRRGFH